MHPLRKLRESGKATPAQVSEFLAENIVFNSCVYRKLKSDYNGDEVRQGWRVNG
jgi:hypothetical protein